MDSYIYLDNASSTKIDSEVLNTMMPYLIENYGNPSGAYNLARKSKAGINNARMQVAKALNSNFGEIYFTSCGSESNNQAIKYIANTDQRKKIMCSMFEHPSVLNTFKYLEKNGIKTVYLPINNNGFVDIDYYNRIIDNKTALVSIMMANNEVGTVQNIKLLAEIAHSKGALFHTDAVQCVGNNIIDVKELDVDFLSISAHKFYGPKGIGALYIKNNLSMEPLIHGGSQEKGLRAGTENIANIVGLGKAIELVNINASKTNITIKNMKNYLVNKIINKVEDVYINASLENRLANNLNIYVKGVPANILVARLDMHNIYISVGASCSSGNNIPSHVIMAIYNDEMRAKSSIRISLGKYNTLEEIDYFVEILNKTVEELRT